MTRRSPLGSAPNEIAGGQLFDLSPVEGLGIELSVESFPGFTLRETRLAEAVRA
jgi:hypothetical protein